MPGHYGGPRRAKSRGRQMVSSRRKPSTTRGRSSAEARKARTARNQRMRSEGSSKRTRTTGQNRTTKTARTVAKGPKKDTRTRGGQGGVKGGNDQAAFARFVAMTPAQQREVMRMADGEKRRRTR